MPARARAAGLLRRRPAERDCSQGKVEAAVVAFSGEQPFDSNSPYFLATAKSLVGGINTVNVLQPAFAPATRKA